MMKDVKRRRSGRCTWLHLSAPEDGGQPLEEVHVFGPLTLLVTVKGIAVQVSSTLLCREGNSLGSRARQSTEEDAFKYYPNREQIKTDDGEVLTSVDAEGETGVHVRSCATAFIAQKIICIVFSSIGITIR